MAKAFVAIQVGAVSFVDEGVDPLLDLLRERGRVNALSIPRFLRHDLPPCQASPHSQTLIQPLRRALAGRGYADSRF